MRLVWLLLRFGLLVALGYAAADAPYRKPRRRRRPLHRVEVWNMKVGRGQAAVDGLAELIEARDPDVVLLQEAMNYIRRLRKEFGHEWRIYSGLPFTSRANCPVMVRRDVPHGGKRGQDWGIVTVRATWVYRGRGRFVRHPGRSWTWAIADGVALMSMHRATEALGFNAKTGKREAERIKAWARRFSEWLIGGDWNNHHTDPRQNGPRDIANDLDADLVVPDDARIDFALSSEDLVEDTRRGARRGSDHHSHEYDLAA